MKKFIKDTLSRINNKEKSLYVEAIIEIIKTLLGVLCLLFCLFICICFILILVKLGTLVHSTLFQESVNDTTHQVSVVETFKYNIWCDDYGPYKTNEFNITDNTVTFNTKNITYSCNEFVIKEMK